jgi:hypothetical protein
VNRTNSGDQDMADILSGPDGTTTTHSPRTTTHRPPNHGRITPISSHMLARFGDTPSRLWAVTIRSAQRAFGVVGPWS